MDIQDSMRRFNRLIFETDAAYHEAAVKLGLSDSAMTVLYTALYGGGSCPIAEICAAGVSKQTVNSCLRKLERDGIVRLESLGGREKKVCLTEKGTELARRTAARVIDAENSVMGAWPEEELEQYISLTDRYLREFKEKISQF